MTIATLKEKGVPNTEIARMLEVTEGAVRYHVARSAAEAVDGRSRQLQRAATMAAVIAEWMGGSGDRPNLAALHDELAREHGYEGSLRSVQRYVAKHFPKPAIRARRRVETPPGAQSQVDWAEHRGVWIGGELVDLYAFHMRLSHSRRGATVWSTGKDQLAWQQCHVGAFQRLGGVTATVRVDNEKTAVSHGAGAWGEINPSYRRFAQTLRFHVDACPPRTPEAKGKVERGIRTSRGSDPRRRHWNSLAELQQETDREDERRAASRLCPATGKSVRDTWLEERRLLTPLPEILPEPFDVVVTRRVGIDCMVSFESRQYSVPFAYVGQMVEIRGCHATVQVLADCKILASHPRHTDARLVIDEKHFDGEATDRVLPPPPLGRMGLRLQQIAALEAQRRPINLYAALAEVAR
ncbi:MAG TPA: IS21 family transposase [Vicinamibacterales bacterium]|jgi:transposase|nr:IS21 family transposase [Vicinamibacterales bacterium]